MRPGGWRWPSFAIATMALLAVTTSAFASTASIGPQAMEGALKIDPGDVVKAGFSLTIPGSHPETTVQFVDATVAFNNVTCVSGYGGGTFTVALGSGGAAGPYTVPANDSSWFPTGDQHSDAAYQGSLPAPDLCHGGTMSLRNGGTFSGDLQSDDTHSINVRFHYSANGTSGSWSATKTFDPDPISGTPVPSGAIGSVGLALVAAAAFAVASRRKRRAFAK